MHKVQECDIFMSRVWPETYFLKLNLTTNHKLQVAVVKGSKEKTGVDLDTI